MAGRMGWWFAVGWLGLAGLSCLLVASRMDVAALKGQLALLVRHEQALREELSRRPPSPVNDEASLDYLQWQFVVKEQVAQAGRRLRERLAKVPSLKKDRALAALLHDQLGLNETLAADFGAAIREYEEALRLDPTDADSCYNLGLLYSTYHQDPRKAAAYYKRYLRLAPADSAKAREVEDRVRILDR